MTRHLRAHSVVLLLGIGAAAPAPASQLADNPDAARLPPYMHLSQTGAERFDTVNPGYLGYIDPGQQVMQAMPEFMK